MEYNHDRPLSDFEKQIEIIKNAGFKPIAVSQMVFEDTFVFETSEESTKAYNTLERDSKNKWIGTVVGWWYGKEDFEKEVKEYESKNGAQVRTHWIQ